MTYLLFLIVTTFSCIYFAFELEWSILFNLSFISCTIFLWFFLIPCNVFEAESSIVFSSIILLDIFSTTLLLEYKLEKILSNIGNSEGSICSTKKKSFKSLLILKIFAKFNKSLIPKVPYASNIFVVLSISEISEIGGTLFLYSKEIVSFVLSNDCLTSS